MLESEKQKGCKKLYEKKDFLEWYIVEQTVNYVLTPGRMELIAKSVVAEYENEFNDNKIKQLERQAAKLEQDINKYTESLLELPKSSWASVGQKIETATMQKTDIEIDLAKLRVANKIRYTEKEIVAWLKLFCKGDLFDMKFRQRIIDTFINSIFLYDDRIIIFYNIRGGKQVSYIDMLDATKEAPDSVISDMEKGTENICVLNDMVNRSTGDALIAHRSSFLLFFT